MSVGQERAKCSVWKEISEIHQEQEKKKYREGASTFLEIIDFWQ